MSSSTIPIIRQLSAAEAHSLWAESYDRDPNPLLALEERVVVPLLPALDGMLIVDVACGTGRWVAHLLRHGARFGVGLDLSSQMLKEAQRKPSLHNRLVRADGAEIPLSSEAVHLAMCSFAVSYIPDLQRFARGLSKIIKRGGHLFLSDWHPSAHLRGWKRTFRHKGTMVEIESFRHSIAGLCSAFAVEGFDLATCIEPCFDEAERHIFEKAGKGHLLEQLFQEPAIFVCHFRKT